GLGPRTTPAAQFSFSNLWKGALKGGLANAVVEILGKKIITGELDNLNRKLYTPGERIRAEAFRNNLPGLFDGPSFSDNPFGSKPACRETLGSGWHRRGAAGSSEGNPEQVSLLGTPPVVARAPGVQQVRVMNPPPAPQVNQNLTMHAQPPAPPEEIGNLAA